MNKKERLYAVIGGCVGAVLTMLVCSFFPLDVRSQAHRFGEITCTELKVLSINGNEMIKLTSDEQGGRVSIYATDKIRGAIGMGISEHGGRVTVMGKDGNAMVDINKHGGLVTVLGKSDDGSVTMEIDEIGAGTVSVMSEKVDGDADFISIHHDGHGGSIKLWGRGNGGVLIGNNDHGGYVHADGKKKHSGSVVMKVGERGGTVDVWANEGDGGASMGVDEHGGNVAVFGKGNSKSRAAMGVTAYGNGAVSTWDKNGYRQ